MVEIVSQSLTIIIIIIITWFFIFYFSNDFAYPSTLGFALLENYIEIGHNLREYLFGHRADTKVFEEEVNLSSRRTADILENVRRPSTPVSPAEVSHAPTILSYYNPSLLVHHLAFLMVEFHTFRTRSVAYYCNMFKMYEATAPVSFLVWVAQRRKKWRDQMQKLKQGENKESDAKSSVEKEKRKLILGCENTVLQLSILRIVVWLCCRTLFDVVMMRTMNRDGIFPWGRNAGRLSLGNRIQLWVAAPMFWFGLNPLWLHGMVKALLRLIRERRDKALLSEKEKEIAAIEEPPSWMESSVHRLSVEEEEEELIWQGTDELSLADGHHPKTVARQILIFERGLDEASRIASSDDEDRIPTTTKEETEIQM
jgi:hypothetical protein